jgi:hypothetical protein
MTGEWGPGAMLQVQFQASIVAQSGCSNFAAHPD